MTRPQRPGRTGVGSRRVNAVTTALIGINVAVYLAELAAGGSTDGTGNWIYDHGALFATAFYVGRLGRRRRARRVVAAR